MAKSGSMDMRTVMGWAVGVAGIALLLLIMLILFGNLSDNVGFGDDSITIVVSNETGAYINATEYTLSVVNSSTSGYVITAVWNATPTALVLSGNYSVSSLGNLTNLTESDFSTGSYALNVSYTYSLSFDSVGKANTNNFINNYTQSVLNTSKQFPVVGTIIGVGLLLFILIALLVFALSKMTRIGGSSGGNFG